MTELVGDVIVLCAGGQPRAAGESLPQFNLQVFTSPGINVTSRTLAPGGTGNFTEALMFIDEPSPAKQTICGSEAYPYSIPPGTTATVISGVCGAHAASPAGNGAGSYDPDAAAPTGFFRGNVYQARQVTPTSLIWQGIPFDPPGEGATRILRLTNIRVNASQLNTAAGSITAINLVLSASASGIQNPIALPLANPNVTVASALTSLAVSVTPLACLQCESSCNGNDPLMIVRELFPTAFRRRSSALAAAVDVGTPVSPVPQGQMVLGTVYQTESGFYRRETNGNRWPAVLANGSLAAGTAAGTLGLADQGTRVLLRFQDIADGMTIYLQPVVAIRSPQASGRQTGTAVVVATDPNGAGPFALPLPADPEVPDAWPQVAIVGGTGSAVYEILDTDTTALEEMQIRLDISYSGTPAYAPKVGTESASAQLAPLAASSAVPRFATGATPVTILSMNACRTNILFPFVSNQAGFDTGLALVNTTKDPFFTTSQTGACQVNFYGTVGSSKVTLQFPSPAISGGEHLVWSLSTGGAVAATAGFQGYVIASCAFQYGHGYAFISDIGAQRLAMGYLGLVMDDPLIPPGRTQDVAETLGH